MSSQPTSNLASGWLDLAAFADLDTVIYDGPQVTTLHSKEINPVSYFTRIPVPMKGTGQSSSVTHVREVGHFAENTWFVYITPDITVNAGVQNLYRIAYCPNQGHNAVNTGAFCVNYIPIVKFDSIAMDQLSEANLNNNVYDAYMRMIGNTNKAVNWTLHLPPIKVKVPLHELWYCQKEDPVPGNALPLCCLKQNTVTLQFEFVSSFTELIRIQQNQAANPSADPANWQDINPANVNLANIVTVLGPNGLVFPTPYMWTEYVLVQDDERAMDQASTIDTIIEQVQRFSSQKMAVGDTRFTFHFSYPMRYLLFAALNQNSVTNNYYSNYTTNPLDNTAGLDPIRQVTLWYDNVARFQNFYGDHFSDLEFMWHAARVPAVTGMHLLAYCYKTTATEIDGSSNYSKLATDLEVIISETSTDTTDPATIPSQYTGGNRWNFNGTS